MIKRLSCLLAALLLASASPVDASPRAVGVPGAVDGRIRRSALMPTIPMGADYTTLESRQPFKLPEPANYGTNQIVYQGLTAKDYAPESVSITNIVTKEMFTNSTSALLYNKLQFSTPQNLNITIQASNITARLENGSVAVVAEFEGNQAGYRHLLFSVLPSAWPGPVLSTNTVVVSAEGDNRVGCATCAMLNPWKPGMTFVAIPAIHHPWHPDGLPYTEATEKWTTTQAIRRETATFNWRGQSATLTNDTLLSAVTNRWKLKIDWEKLP